MLEERYYIESLLFFLEVFYGNGVKGFYFNLEYRWRKEYCMMMEKERQVYYFVVNKLKRLRVNNFKFEYL